MSIPASLIRGSKILKILFLTLCISSCGGKGDPDNTQADILYSDIILLEQDYLGSVYYTIGAGTAYLLEYDTYRDVELTELQLNELTFSFERISENRQVIISNLDRTLFYSNETELALTKEYLIQIIFFEDNNETLIIESKFSYEEGGITQLTPLEKFLDQD